VHKVTRSEWRDAIRAQHCLLSPTERHVALTMADYIPKPEAPEEDLFCTLATIAGHTGLSERTIIRATNEIVAKGYAVQTSPKSQYRSPRYRPLVPAVQEDQTCQPVMSGGDNVSGPEVTDWQVTLDVTPDMNPNSPSSQATMPAPARRAAPPAASPTKKSKPSKQAKADDRAIWMTLMLDRYDEDEADLPALYELWLTKYRTPGAYALGIDRQGTLDGFLGERGLDLGMYDDDEAEDDDPWATDGPWATKQPQSA
jgi:hypothetical protein